jgi:hypothetical protein
MAANSKLPFVGRILWKVFAVIAVLLVVAWVVIPRVTDYRITAADYGGSSIAALILSYLVHLWLLPGPEPPPGDD